MKRWRDLAAPDDPDSWYAVDNMMPTPRGTYMTVPPTFAVARTATGAGTVRIGFIADTLSSYVEWVFDSSKIWLFNGATYADKTNGVTIGTYPHPVQFGNVTVVAMGVGNATVASTSGGNFAAVAAAPQAEILVVQSNTVLAFNTNASTDGWAACDTTDHTNWTTGEAASGRLIATPGAILAAVALGDSVYVFKARGVYRMWYVGGLVKWASQLINPEVGIGLNSGGGAFSKYSLGANETHMVFTSPGDALHAGASVCLMDGTGQYRKINPLTTVIDAGYAIRYVAAFDCFTLIGTTQIQSYIYSLATDALGFVSAPFSGAVSAPSLGQSNTVQDTMFPLGVAHRKSANDELTRYGYTVSGFASKSCYLQTSMLGSSDKKLMLTRVTPLLRRRVDYGADSAALSATFYRERYDTSATDTKTPTESTDRKRFDLTWSDNFARLKVTWAALDVEVDDIAVEGRNAGK